MEEEEPEIKKTTATSSEVIWEMEKNSASLENSIRSPRSLHVDDNNKLYIGVTDGVYLFNLKKIANRKFPNEGFIDVNEILKKQFTKDSINEILHEFNKKAREGQEKNYTTATMLRHRLKIGSILESKVLLKSFQVSPNGLLPNNEPIIVLLLNTDMLILMGRIYGSFMTPYVSLTNCNLLAASNENQFPLIFDVHCFTWVNISQDDETRIALFFVHYGETLEGWAFSFHSIQSKKSIEFRCVLKEEYKESSGIMTGNSFPGAVYLLISDNTGKVAKISYEVKMSQSFSEMSLKRVSVVDFKTNLTEIQFLSILPRHLLPDDTAVRFVYVAQNNCFVGDFNEVDASDCFHSHAFPTNISELLYHENGLELFFMDGSNMNYDISKNECATQRKQGVYGVFGASYSSTQILKFLVGPPHYFALKKTNLQILSNLSDNSPYFDIIYRMSEKINSNLVKKEGKNYYLYLSKKSINFSDILMMFATNQVNYRHFLKAYFGTYEKNLTESKSKKKAALKDLLKGINSDIVEKFGLTPEVKNHIERVLLLNLLYFSPETFKDFLNKLMNKSILNFYTSMVLWCQEELKDNEQAAGSLYINKLKSYLREDGTKSIGNMEVENEQDTDACPICDVKLSAKESECVNKHIVLRCFLSRQVIYFGDYYECKLCKQKYLKECLERYSKYGLDLNFSCVLCCNLLKRV